MNESEMKRQTKEFAKQVVYLCRLLPQTRESRLIGDQLFRAGTSVGANYRAACRGRSKADFVAKLGIVLEEADESLYWMEIMVETGIMQRDAVLPLMKEANKLVAMMVASINTARTSSAKSQTPNLKSQIQSAV